MAPGFIGLIVGLISVCISLVFLYYIRVAIEHYYRQQALHQLRKKELEAVANITLINEAHDIVGAFFTADPGRPAIKETAALLSTVQVETAATFPPKVPVTLIRKDEPVEPKKNFENAERQGYVFQEGLDWSGDK